MTISAKSLLSSMSPDGNRLDTLLLRYPRFIHSEFMTHRAFSRSTSSSRAIKIEKLIEDVLHDPVFPIHWGKNQKGMHAKEELTGKDLIAARERWTMARDNAIYNARALMETGLHKQLANRVLEPFCHITVVVSSTDWGNFLALRDHDDAQPEIQHLAREVRAALLTAKVNHIKHIDWHMPFLLDEEIKEYGGISDPDGVLRTISAARCARTSYRTHEGKLSTLEDDIKLGKKLCKSKPFHASPFEHQASPTINRYGLERNFNGWVQSRTFMEMSNGQV